MRYKSPNQKIVPTADAILSSSIGRSKYSLCDVTDNNSVASNDSTIDEKKLLRKTSSNDSTGGESSSDISDDLLYPHPLGFRNIFDKSHGSRLGSTRFSLFEEDSDQEEEVEVQGLNTDLLKESYRQRSPHLQSYQKKLTLLPDEQHLRTSFLPNIVLSLHTVGGGSANQTALLSQHLLSHKSRTSAPKKENSHLLKSCGEMERIAHQLKYAANFSSSSIEYPQVRVMDTAALAELSEEARRGQLKIQQMKEKDREKVKRDYKESAEALLLLIEKDEREARLLEEREKREEEEYARLRAENKKEKEAEEERQAIIRKEAELKKIKEKEDERTAKLIKEKKKAEEEEDRRKKEEKERDHLVKAHKLVDQLKQLRATIEPFESSKVQPIPKRRLQYKKMIRGKLNTLTHDPEKIRAVSTEIIETITLAKQEDEQFKELSQRQQKPELSCGKRYLLDLLASNVIVRAQSEQFSGSRGDGFPLACTVALVAAQVKDLCPMVAAHIYSVCPMAIPYLPEGNSDQSEEELMKSLGMIKESGEDYESYDRFISRTEGLISMTAAIMSSEPEGQSIVGHPLKWLVRFLSILPKPPSQLPIITAPVLVAFLTAAGPMLTRKYPAEFKQIFNCIVNDILPRVDNGAVGAPSLVRLDKTLQGGVEHFESTLPKGAIPELYVRGNSNSSRRTRALDTNSSEAEKNQGLSMSGFRDQSNAQVSPFGRPSSIPDSNNIFAPTALPHNMNDANVGIASPLLQVDELDMDAAQEGPQGQESFVPFQSSIENNLPSNRVAANATSSWSSPMTNMPFPLHTTPSGSFASSFPGSNSPSSIQPFNTVGYSQSHSSSPFTNQSGNNSIGQNISSNPFGSTQNNLQSSPFGSAQNNVQPNPFGSLSNNAQSNPFGSISSSTQSNPFGSSQNKSQTNPFRLNRQEDRSFHRSSSNYSENSAKAEGNSRSKANGQYCKFFSQGRCRNGEYCKFLHINA